MRRTHSPLSTRSYKLTVDECVLNFPITRAMSYHHEDPSRAHHSLLTAGPRRSERAAVRTWSGEPPLQSAQ